MFHGEKPIVRNALPEATMSELRNTHFSLGKSSSGYQTETNNYRAFAGHMPDKAFNPKLQSSSPLVPNNRFYGQTTNQRELPVRQLSTNLNRKPEMQTDNFDLSNRVGSYVTESSSK
jgi:hypothetical protein